MLYDTFSLLPVFKIIARHKKTIGYATLIPALCVAVISFFVPDYYTSFCRFIPVNASQIMPSVVFGGGGNYPFGGNTDVDRIQNIANSDALAFALIDSFHLYQYYDFDPKAPKDIARTLKKFKQNYTVTKDLYGGLKLSIENKDNTLAMAMTNAAMAKIIQKDREIATGNLRTMLEILQKSLTSCQREMDSLTQIINNINRTYRYSSLSLKHQVLSQASPGMSYEAQLGVIQNVENLPKDSLSVITEKMYDAGVLDARRSDVNAKYIQIKNNLFNIQSILEADIKTLQIIEPPRVAWTKSGPNRIFWCIGATLFSLFSTVLFLLVRENIPFFEQEINK